MNNKVDWFLKLIRVAGVNFPGAASLIQLQAEIDSVKFNDRLRKLEDPISYLHEDVPELSKEIYRTLVHQDSVVLNFDDVFYVKYSRALAAIESQGLISKNSVLGSRIPLGINLIDPSYILYMCALAEVDEKMEAIVNIVDSCKVGMWLDGEKIKDEINLPKNVIKAVFQIYESKKYGTCSRESGSCKYMGNA